MRFLLSTTTTTPFAEGVSAAYRSLSQPNPTSQASKVPLWLFLLLLLSFASLQVMGQDETTLTYPLGSEPTVVSDKDDYAPGEVAIITGTGWTLDTSVRIHIDEDPHYDHHNDFDFEVNSDGSWRLEFPIDERHLGWHFTWKLLVM